MEERLASILTNKYTGEPALLLGNGINRISEKHLSWNGLLNLLNEKAGTKSSPGSKPLTFLFEEILHEMHGGATKKNIKKLKSDVREAFEKELQPNKLHQQFAGLNIKHILTTNYDYCFEKALDEFFTKPKQTTYRKEDFESSKYSLVRRNTVKNKTIWHIHGELDNGFEFPEKPNKYPEHSIMLGFDQYASYMNRIMELFDFKIKTKDTNNGTEDEIDDETGEESKEDPIKVQKMENIIANQEMWFALFFTHDIHIVGLEMGLFETHLWWLLNLRANLKDRKHCIHNKIVYYISSYELLIKKDQMDLLNSLKVTITPVHCEFNKGNYFKEYYENVLNLLKEYNS